MLLEQVGRAFACGGAPGDLGACSQGTRGCLGDRTGAVAQVQRLAATRCESLRAGVSAARKVRSGATSPAEEDLLGRE